MRSTLDDRVYRWLLVAYPRHVRQVAGDEMTRQFHAERAAHRGRAWSWIWLWLRAALDVLWNGALERLGVRPAVSKPARTLRRTVMRTANQLPDRPGPLDGVLKDLTWGVRRLRGNPAFTIVAALTLALGIGATSAIFSVVNGVLLKPLAFPEANRVVGLFQVWEGKRDVFAPPNFIDVEARAKSFVSAAAYGGDDRTLTGAGDPMRLLDIDVTSGFFNVLETPPLVGRTLTRADNDPGHTHVIVLSFRLWQGRFGGNRAIVGQDVTIDGEPWKVVGVMPAAFDWPLGADSWTPAEYTPSFLRDNRGAWYLNAMARLKSTVTVEQAAAEMADLGRQLERQYPDMDGKVGMTAYSIVDDMLGDTKRALFVLLGAVGFVLLIACVNVANLVIARSASREGELAVRVAMGAGRWRLVRQALIESALLAGLGGAFGLALAIGGLQLLHRVAPPGVPRLDAVSLDTAMVIFTFAATALAGLIFGIAPALQTTGRSLVDSLRERGRSALSGPRGRTARHALVIVEMALAVLLLTGAGLLIRSFSRLMHVDPGFRVDHAVMFRVGLPAARYQDDAARGAFFDRATSELAAMPGAAGVGVVFVVPPTPPTFNLAFVVSGRPPLKPSEQPTMEVRIADPNYFHLMGIAIHRGRSFLDTDRLGTTPVMLVTESAARKFFADEDPIGKHIAIGWRRNNRRVEGDVVGVVADVKSFGVDRDAPAQLYLPLAQAPEDSMAFVVRTTVDPESMFGTIRAAMHRVDPSLPLANSETLAKHVDKSVAARRFYMLLLGLFAAVALTLAAVGIFGVLSFLVTQRTKEIGIRVALGADRGSLVGMVLRQTLMLAGTGAAIGTVAGLGLTGLMATMLFAVKPTDPLTYAAVDSTLLGVAVLAAWVPTRRAVRIDPTIALRE
jgi:putative ABC transport system permease protein